MSTILGPDGRPLITSEGQARELSRTPLAGEVLPARTEAKSRAISFNEAVDLVKSGQAVTPEQLIAKGALGDPETVEKRMRSQAVSMSYIWDRNRGKPKPTPITWETLRLMGNRSEWVRAIVKTRKNQIGECRWAFVPKRDGDQTSETEAMIQDQTRLLSRPSMRGSKPHSRGWREFFGMLLEDLLILDAAAIEKERNYAKWIVALYPVDGATIKPNIDEQGGHYDDAYIQEVDGVITARFGMEELVYMMDNPQTDVRFAGYGLSPLENLITSVTAELYASKYNSTYFEKGSVPEGILNLGEDVPPEDVDAFRLFWMNEIMGRPWALPILGGKGVEWIPFRENNRDMQFMEYQQWLVKKLCAVYQLTPQEIGLIEDVNRSTAESQDESNETKSIDPIKFLFKDYFDVELVGEYGQGVGDYVEFAWEEEGESAEAINAKFQPLVEEGAASRAEWREAHGMDTPEEGTVGAEGLDFFLTSGDLKPLPTAEDADLLSVANQQQREDDQAQQQAEGTGPAADMQWKPGDANDPATRAAMQQHDDEHGIGPRNNQPPDLGKTAPDGRDRHPALTDRQDDLANVLVTKNAELLSVANQQQREDDQAQQQAEGTGPAADMQWKPGDANDPATRAAMQQHDDEHGIGPRNNQPDLGKTGGGVFDGRWTSAPGGKVHTATHRGHTIKIVAQNTAAGGPRWKAYHRHPLGEERIVARGHHLAEVKAQAAPHFPGGDSFGKTAPDGRDRHPALTDRQDDLTDVLVTKNAELIHGLAGILEIPEETLDAALEGSPT